MLGWLDPAVESGHGPRGRFVCEGVVMPASMLGRVARYGVSTLRDSREDRLTAICAALFESPHCEGLARHIALGWLEHASEQPSVTHAGRFSDLYNVLASNELVWSCEPATQIWFANEEGARRPDLGLRFSGRTESGIAEQVLLWVEVKHGTAPHTGQLQAYVDELRAIGIPGAVLLVAPRADVLGFDDHQIPREVPILSWEETAQLVKGFELNGEVGAFLKDDFFTYLKEEGLVDPDQLTAVHLAALTNHREAVSAVGRIADIADAYLGSHWGAASGDYSERGVWQRMYPTGLELSPGSSSAISPSFSWGIWNDGGHWFRDSARRDVPMFAAGLQLTVPVTETSARAFSNHNFGLFSKELGNYRGGGGTRVYRTAYIDDTELDLLASKTLKRQGETVGRWVESAFTELRDALSALSAAHISETDDHE